MRKFLSISAYVVSWMIPLYYEIMLIIDNPWQLLNPFIQFHIIWYTLTTPLYWIALVTGLLFGVWSEHGKQKKVDHNI